VAKKKSIPVTRVQNGQAFSTNYKFKYLEQIPRFLTTKKVALAFFTSRRQLKNQRA
jgi:hypothetical protein